MDRWHRRENINLRLENISIFIMEKYRDLQRCKLTQEELEDTKSVNQIYTLYLCKAVGILTKRGLYKEYIKRENVELHSPKGRMEISESLRQNTRVRGTLICSYDELSDNVLHNQLIKTTLRKMLLSNDISRETQTKIRKALLNFNGIDVIDKKDTEINNLYKRLKFNNGNIRYKTILDLCYTVYNDERIQQTFDYKFKDKVYMTFKNQLYSYYKNRADENHKVEQFNYSWGDKTEKYEIVLSNNRNLVVITNIEKEICMIIDCQQYDYQMDIETENYYTRNIVEICKEYESIYKTKAIGAIIYCNSSEGYTDKDIQLESIDKTEVLSTIIDMNIKKRYIDFKLDNLIKVGMRE